MAPITTATLDQFDRTFDTNARGAFFTVQKALPLMNDGGSIILIASAGKNKATPGRSLYSGTKAALRAFVRTWTMELKDRGIRSNVLSPGATKRRSSKTCSARKRLLKRERCNSQRRLRLAGLAGPRRLRRQRSFWHQARPALLQALIWPSMAD